MVRSTSARRGYAYVLGAAVLFGANASVSKVVMDAGVSAERLTALRCVGAAVGLLVLLLATGPGRLRVSPRDLPALFALGLAGAALMQWFYFEAIDRLPVGIALLLEFTGPVMVALWCRVVLREQVRRRLWLAIGLALAGLALVAQVWRDTGLDPVGVAAGLAAAVCLATYYLLGRHLLGGATVTGRDPLATTFWMFTFGGLTWSVVLPWQAFSPAVLGRDASLQGALAGVAAPAWLALVWVVVLGTLVPYALNLAALRHLPATSVGVVGMAEPVIAALVAWAWLRQSLSPVQVLGGLTVLAGVGLAQTAGAAARVPPPAQNVTGVPDTPGGSARRSHSAEAEAEPVAGVAWSRSAR